MTRRKKVYNPPLSFLIPEDNYNFNHKCIITVHKQYLFDTDYNYKRCHSLLLKSILKMGLWMYD